jgi:hypothetical protein
MSTFISNSTPSGWREAVKQLDEANRQFNKLYGIMTPLEKHFVTEQISEAREKYRQFIENGLISEHAAAINNYLSKLDNIERERRNVTNSWDAAELGAQMQVYQKLVEVAAGNADLGSLQKIYQEAKDSGDRNKLKAAAVAIASASARTPTGAQDIHGEDVRRGVNLLRKQAARDLEALDTSPNLQAANEAEGEARAALIQANKQIFQTADVMGELSQNGAIIHNFNLMKEAERVHIDGAGNIGIKIEETPTPENAGLSEEQKKLMQMEN